MSICLDLLSHNTVLLESDYVHPETDTRSNSNAHKSTRFLLFIVILFCWMKTDSLYYCYRHTAFLASDISAWKESVVR